MKIVKKIKSKYFICFCLNLSVLIMALLFCDIKFEVSDDFIMETILSGAYGSCINPHMLFINVLYGKLLAPLYLLNPHINWYTISLLFWGFMACIGVAYLLCDLLDYKLAIFLDILFLTAFSNDIYILIQFTKTATFCCITGSLLVFDSLFSDLENQMIPIQKTKVVMSKCKFFYGVILCLIGSWLRIQVVYLVAPFVLILMIYECMRWLKLFKGKKYIHSLFLKKFYLVWFLLLLYSVAMDLIANLIRIILHMNIMQSMPKLDQIS